jgi:hypothetical protein
MTSLFSFEHLEAGGRFELVERPVPYFETTFEVARSAGIADKLLM